MKLAGGRLAAGWFPAALRKVYPFALVSVLGCALLAVSALGLDLRRLQTITRTREVLQSVARRTAEARRACDALRGDNVPQGLVSRFQHRQEFDRARAETRRLLRNDPGSRQLAERFLAEGEGVLDYASRALLLQVEAGLARSGGNERQARDLEERIPPTRREMNERYAAAEKWLGLLEARSTPAAALVSRTARSAAVVVIAGAILLALFLLQQWDSWKTRRRHTEGTRLVEDMLEAYSRRLEAMNAELEQLNLLKTQFLANTSHELLTPLNGILGSLELLREGGCVSPEEEREFIEQAHASARQLLALIQDLLDLCRLEEGSVALHRRTVETGPLLERALLGKRPLMEERGLTLLVVPPAEGWPRVVADPERLTQVLQHLLSNAIKFTQEGSIRVSGRLEREGEPRLRIEVTDTGVGIEPEVLPDMFELFRQADASHKRRFGGTGLGLTLSRHLVQGMGGRIGIESDGPGRGTRVWFTIPTAPAAGAGPEGTGTTADPPARMGGDPGIREAA